MIRTALDAVKTVFGGILAVLITFVHASWAVIGARISPQSRVIGNRNELKAAFVKEASRLIGKKVPRPEHWGGYYILPDLVEFWQGRASRLHDRIRYLRSGDREWKIERLAP